MQVDDLLKPFPIKEFHPFPRALMGPGAHELIGPAAKRIGFQKTLIMTSGCVARTSLRTSPSR